MFENDSDGAGQKRTHQVRLEMRDGRSMLGLMYSSITRSMQDELNSSDGFIAFEAHNGEQKLVSKQALAQVVRIDMPKADQLERRITFVDKAAPHQILGVAPDADPDAIRTAFRRLAKAYHPDRYTGMQLPKEIIDYVDAVQRRINVAYTLLEPGTGQEAEADASA